MKLRKLTFILHQFVGVILGALIVVINITGSSLVFWEEINEFLHPQLFHVVRQSEQVSVQSVLDKVKLTYPDSQITFIDLPPKPDSVYTLWLTSDKYKAFNVYVNPYSRVILGSQIWGNTLMTFIYELHINLLAGEVGDRIVGICGLALLLLTITGLILWPGWKRLLTGFVIRWRSPKHILNYDIHKIVGILSVIFITIVASTGAAMIFYEQFQEAIYSISCTPKIVVPKSTVIVGKQPVSIDKIIQEANLILPEGKTTFVSIPKKLDDTIKVTKKLPQESSKDGRTRIYFDRYNGELLQVENALKASLVTQVVDSLLTLHIGVYGGLGMRVCYLVMGLTPTILGITGLILWRQGKLAKAQRQAAIRQLQQQQ